MSYLRLAGGSGTFSPAQPCRAETRLVLNLVDQMRPASRLAMPMFAVPFMQSKERNEFRRRAAGNLVWPSRKLGAGDTDSASNMLPPSLLLLSLGQG